MSLSWFDCQDMFYHILFHTRGKKYKLNKYNNIANGYSLPLIKILESYPIILYCLSSSIVRGSPPECDIGILECDRQDFRRVAPPCV